MRHFSLLLLGPNEGHTHFVASYVYHFTKHLVPELASVGFDYSQVFCKNGSHGWLIYKSSIAGQK